MIMAHALEVAENRERAGVHYSSDTAAGKELATGIFEILKTDCTMFKALLQEAKHEWTADRNGHGNASRNGHGRRRKTKTGVGPGPEDSREARLDGLKAKTREFLDQRPLSRG